MLPTQPPSSHSQASAHLQQLTARIFFGSGFVTSVVGLLMAAFVPLGLPSTMRWMVIAITFVMAVTFVAASLLIKQVGMQAASLVASWVTLCCDGLLSIGFGEGVHSPIIGFGAIVVCQICFVVNLRTGVVMAAFGALEVTLLAFAELNGWFKPVAPIPPAVVAVHAIVQAMLIGCGLAAGALINRIFAATMEASLERESRLRSLLRIAADGYWEMDTEFRFTRATKASKSRHELLSARIGQRPWEIDDFGAEPPAMDALRHCLESHQSFRGLLVRRRDPHGNAVYARVSGQARYDEQGFAGYWGVARDSTPEILAQASVVASETRYRELFRRAPSPLVLHRMGRVIDANPAALGLFSYAHLEDMKGRSLSSHFEEEDSAGRFAAQLAAVEQLPAGRGTEEQVLRLVTTLSMTRHVRAAMVKIDMSDGPAVLAIFLDETEQRVALAALSRSQSLLSHLIEASPDSIGVSELPSGKLVMVNGAFTKWVGHSLEDSIGRTTTELGIWQNAHDRVKLMEILSREGRVDSFPTVFIDKHGEGRRAMLSAAAFSDSGQRYLMVSARDVTDVERTRLEHQAMLNHAGIGIAFTREQRFQHTNPQFDRIFGWPDGSLAGERALVVWPTDADYEELEDVARPLLAAGKPVEVERPMRRLDGSTFWCRLLAQVVDPNAPSQGGTIWIAEDITERRRVDQALAQARDDAEAANRAKSAFLANTSHEIRTPLNGLLGMAQLAMKDGLDETLRRQYLAQIQDSAQNLAGIISDVLDLSKIESGKFTLETVRFRLRDTLQAVHRAHLPAAEEKGLALELQVDPALPEAVRGDPLRVRQLITNYVSNAIKFTAQGSVRIAARRLPSDWLRIEVSDTGPGIEPAILSRLFEPFTQADDSTTRRYGGTGLGLSICRQFAHLMGGEVGVQSRPGAGSTFWAELPLEDATNVDVEIPVAKDPAARLKGARVLVAEDNPVNMTITVAMLEQWGVHVMQAINGQAAIDAVQATVQRGEPVDAVLMDVQMPGMSGHEAARTLRRRFDSRQLPIIALTAAALVSEREQALAAGMNEFLTKPIDANRLRDTITRYVRDPS